METLDGWLRTASPTSAEHARTQREVGRLVLKPPPSVSMRRFPEIRFGKRYNGEPAKVALLLCNKGQLRNAPASRSPHTVFHSP